MKTNDSVFDAIGTVFGFLLIACIALFVIACIDSGIGWALGYSVDAGPGVVIERQHAYERDGFGYVSGSGAKGDNGRFVHHTEPERYRLMRAIRA